jgi:hypothetical protein
VSHEQLPLRGFASVTAAAPPLHDKPKYIRSTRVADFATIIVEDLHYIRPTLNAQRTEQLNAIRCAMGSNHCGPIGRNLRNFALYSAKCYFVSGSLQETERERVPERCTVRVVFPLQALGAQQGV